ncbi:hypothetical protein Tco_0539315, partial [Tanacetum coccineum]
SSDEASLGDQEDASKQGRKIDDIDKDVEITLVDETQGSEVTDKAGEKKNIVKEAVDVTNDVTIPVSAATITNVELTLAQTLGQGLKDKGKSKMIEPEKPLKKKDQIKFDEEDRLAREKAQQVEEANIVWDDIQEKIDADY